MPPTPILTWRQCLLGNFATYCRSLETGFGCQTRARHPRPRVTCVITSVAHRRRRLAMIRSIWRPTVRGPTQSTKRSCIRLHSACLRPTSPATRMSETSCANARMTLRARPRLSRLKSSLKHAQKPSGAPASRLAKSSSQAHFASNRRERNTKLSMESRVG